MLFLMDTHTPFHVCNLFENLRWKISSKYTHTPLYVYNWFENPCWKMCGHTPLYVSNWFEKPWYNLCFFKCKLDVITNNTHKYRKPSVNNLLNIITPAKPSSWCRAASSEFPDTLSLAVPIIHRSCQALPTVFMVRTALMWVFADRPALVCTCVRVHWRA